MAQTFFLLAVPLLAGALIPIQTGANRQLASAFDSPLFAAGGSMALAALILIGAGLSSMRLGAVARGFAGLPLWALGGGLLGAVFVTSAIVIAPRIGASRFLLLVFLGQMVMALLTDRFGLFGFAPREIAPRQIFALFGVIFCAALALAR